ncbi:hypothetical protein GW916_00340 [bacterium]|nr:hypothetical protein [bacterium]
MTTTNLAFTGFTGLNNKISATRLNYDPQTGVSELAEAVNVDIDDSGGMSRRLGQVELDAGTFLNVFCDKGDCFVVQDRADDSAVLQVGKDFSLSGIRSGMTKGAMVSFCQIGSTTPYMNGFESGVIEAGISSSWPDYIHLGAKTNREFYPAPIGTHIAYFDGHMLIAQGNTIWISEKYEIGKFRMAKNFWQMGTEIRMIRPVLNGIWVSDHKVTGFVPATESRHISAWPFLPRSSFPAHEWSDAHSLVELSSTPGESAVWSSDEGLCIGTADGQIIVPTKNKLKYPAGSRGATVINDFNTINSVY